LILQEQFAISVKRTKEAKTNVGGDFGRLADLEDKMFRQKFVQEPISPWVKTAVPEEKEDLRAQEPAKEESAAVEVPQQESVTQNNREASDEGTTSQNNQSSAQESVQDNAKETVSNKQANTQESSADNNENVTSKAA